MLQNDTIRASKVIIRELLFTEVCSKPDKQTIPISIPDKISGEDLTYYVKNSHEPSRFLHFPVVLKEDGNPWEHATIYLLTKAESVVQPSSKTLESIATDLVMFHRYLDSEKIDYLDFPKRKLRRPTYRYRMFLQSCMENGEISANTASRRISGVIGFYRWLEKQHDTDFQYPPWQENEISISFNNAFGLSSYKLVKTTDLSVNVPKSRENFSERINDSGKLRPLSSKEQRCLVESLYKIANPEMTLAFLLALTTGARIQTVFTLRLKQIQGDYKNTKQHMPIVVGMGTGVDTKFQRRMMIYIPGWLAERLEIYSQSQRAIARREKSSHDFDDADNQYLFLTRSGKPYYVAESDPNKSAYRSPPSGNAVRRFIASQLKPVLALQGADFEFSFHDLRATFGMNLLEEKLAHSAEETKLFDVLMLIRDRMGHSKLSTTEGYLQYRKKLKLVTHIQSEFEEYLIKLTQGGMGDE